jgi:hypothetical protein
MSVDDWSHVKKERRMSPDLRIILKPLAFVAGLALASGAVAGTPITYTDGDKSLFRVEVPDFWSVRTGGIRDLDDGAIPLRDVSRVMGLTPEAHDGIWVGLISPHGVSTLDEAVAYLQEIGQFMLTDPQVEPARSLRIGGMPSRAFTGRGVRNGISVSFTAVMVDLPNGRVAISVVIVEAGADAAILDDVNAMFTTLRAIR